MVPSGGSEDRWKAWMVPSGGSEGPLQSEDGPEWGQRGPLESEAGPEWGQRGATGKRGWSRVGAARGRCKARMVPSGGLSQSSVETNYSVNVVLRRKVNQGTSCEWPDTHRSSRPTCEVGEMDLDALLLPLTWGLFFLLLP